MGIQLSLYTIDKTGYIEGKEGGRKKCRRKVRKRKKKIIDTIKGKSRKLSGTGVKKASFYIRI